MQTVFRKKFPQKYQEKQNPRLRICPVCDSQRELVGRICKPCRRVRSCPGCQTMNMERDARKCKMRSSLRATLGASAPKLALWCHTCTTETDRSVGVCQGCLPKSVECVYCKRSPPMCTPSWRDCQITSCSTLVRICNLCEHAHGSHSLLCIACWKATGKWCIQCHAEHAQDMQFFAHRCRPCKTKYFCASCG